MAGVLPMDDETQVRVRALARGAARRENWYRPGEAAVPGDSPTHTEEVGSYRVVFSWTVDPVLGRPFRHLSVSNLSARGLPAPEAVFTLAYWLGFTGARPDDHGVVRPGKANREWKVATVDNGVPHVVVGEMVADA